MIFYLSLGMDLGPVRKASKQTNRVTHLSLSLSLSIRFMFPPPPFPDQKTAAVVTVTIIRFQI